MNNPFVDDPQYLDVLKVMQLGGEGGKETLFRVLPKGEANFIWYSVGSGGIDDDFSNDEGDILADYEDISEYLIEKLPQLAGYYLEYADPAFREQVFAAFLSSLREIRRQPPLWNPMSNILRDSPSGSWCAWQKHLGLTSPEEKLIIHSALVEVPVLELTLDSKSLRSNQQLLDLLYLTLAHFAVPARTYGSCWQLYDLVSCRSVHFPGDDRADNLRDDHLMHGGRWLLYGPGLQN